MLDIKVGCNNVVLGDAQKKYTGFLIYYCVFIFNRLVFGHKKALVHF